MRGKKGNLWIIGGDELSMKLQILNTFGLYFKFTKNGGKVTNSKPSWYMITKVISDNETDKFRYYMEDEYKKFNGKANIPLPSTTISKVDEQLTENILQLDEPKLQVNTLEIIRNRNEGLKSQKYFLHFIEHICPEAAKNAELMEKLIHQDAASALVKGRSFAEAIVGYIICEEEIDEPDLYNLNKRVNYLRKEDLIPADMKVAFDNIRKTGNGGAHEGHVNDINVALSQHKAMYDIGKWFYEIYQQTVMPVPIYSQPDLTSKIDEKQIEKMVDDKLNDKLEAIIAKNLPTPPPKEEASQPPKQEFTPDRVCIVDELSKLKESSKEAVESLHEFSKFKEYMHIERDVQGELHDILNKASEIETNQLILVCGSVGDGKSHLISYFQDKHRAITDRFTLHNDATESREPNKTAMDTLNELLDDFSDEKIGTTTTKIIIAINLGTLNNFVDSQYGSRFTKLKQYVIDKKILVKGIEPNPFDSKSHIQFIDFSDYNLYSLDNGVAKSDYVKTFFKKVTDISPSNPFYQSFKTNCRICKNQRKCPIEVNYKLLSQENVQDAIIDLLVQCVVKYKLIVSTRALLNFIYDLLVPRNIDVNSPMFKEAIYKQTPDAFIASLMPNTIFGHKELSFIFNSLNRLDPLNLRTKGLDDFVLGYTNSLLPLGYFKNYIDAPEGMFTKLESVDFSIPAGKKTQKKLLQLFIRSYALSGKGELFDLTDKVYADYMTHLYQWNRGQLGKLKPLYREIIQGVQKWNGVADKNQVNIFIGKNQTDYKISEELDLKEDFSNLPHETKETKLVKFMPELEIKLSNKAAQTSFPIEVDFPLYELLNKVNRGYRPNKKDKNYFIQFVEFLNHVVSLGSQDIELFFTEKNQSKNKQYRLEYEENYGTYKFMEVEGWR